MVGAEPLGEVVTGGLAGRAVEPATGEVGPDGHTTERSCLNCGTPLLGDYCHACGQRGHVHRSLRAFGHDLLHGVFHFEGKIWRTLPMLAWRPGELTRRYIEGQRASYISPIALFLFCVFLMFAVLSATGTLRTPDSSAVQRELQSSIAKEEATVARLQRKRQQAIEQRQPTADIDARLREARDDLEGLRTVRGAAGGRTDDVPIGDEVPDWLRAPIVKAGRNPELLVYKLKTNAYKFSWMLIPLSVPFLWLLFPFSRKFRLYDHTVFVTYSLCFMTLLAIFAGLMMRAGLSSVAGLLWLVPPVHMYRQLRGAYSLTRPAALLRTVLLLAFAMIAATLFILILVSLGIFE